MPAALLAQTLAEALGALRVTHLIQGRRVF